MPVALFGLSYKTAPLDLREAVSFDAESLARSLPGLTCEPSVREAVVVGKLHGRDERQARAVRHERERAARIERAAVDGELVERRALDQRGTRERVGFGDVQALEPDRQRRYQRLARGPEHLVGPERERTLQTDHRSLPRRGADP